MIQETHLSVKTKSPELKGYVVCTNWTQNIVSTDWIFSCLENFNLSFESEKNNIVSGERFSNDTISTRKEP